MPCRKEKDGVLQCGRALENFLVRQLLTKGTHRWRAQGEEGAVCNVTHKSSWTSCVFDDRARQV
jgi:hypothetical protein